MSSIIFNTDSYKSSHWLQYPPNTQYLSSYIEARGSKELNKCLFFGLQVFIENELKYPINQQQINSAEKFYAQHGVPFYKAGWEYILEKYHGYLPIEIQALPEGTVVGLSTPVVQVINTDPNCYWLTSYIETAILRAVWYPSTVATLSLHCKEIIQKGMETSCDTLDKLPFMLNDFGA